MDRTDRITDHTADSRGYCKGERDAAQKVFDQPRPTFSKFSKHHAYRDENIWRQFPDKIEAICTPAMSAAGVARLYLSYADESRQEDC